MLAPGAGKSAPAAERQRPSRHGAVLGAALAGLAESMAPLHPAIPERCSTCAFRAGTIPNQMAGTLVEALNCVAGLDPAPFGCHHTLGAGRLPTTLCSGYLLARLSPESAFKEAIGGVLIELGYEEDE